MYLSSSPPIGAKMPYSADTHVYLTKDALMQTALRMWGIAKDVVADDDAICDAMRASSFKAVEELAAAAAVRDMPGVPESYDTMNRLSYANATPEERAQVRVTLEAVQAKRAALDKAIEAMYVHRLVASADGQLMAIGLTRWAENGFPQVTMGHKYCAALLCTGTDAETLSFVKPPWSAFFIEVPPGLLPVDSETCGPTEVKRILVLQLQNKTKGKTWGYIAYTETFITMWRFGADVSELEPPSIEGEEHFAHLLQSEEFTTQDRRVVTLIGRLIINTCLAMSDKNNVKPIGPRHKTYAASRNKKDERELVVRTFQVGAPVKLDLRDDVKTYVQHGPRKPGGGAPNVQVTVRGHFKTQRHGPKNTLVKVIWRQPFRRGRKNAPVLVRPHELGKE
jgi:hypothetical protein